MIRCTIELLPGGDEDRARPIGCVEISNIGGTADVGEYNVVMKKTPPFRGALRAAWKKGRFRDFGYQDNEIIVGGLAGHHRTRRGVYDLLYSALKACGLEARTRNIRLAQLPDDLTDGGKDG